jgi:hypothetical protein
MKSSILLTDEMLTSDNEEIDIKKELIQQNNYSKLVNNEIYSDLLIISQEDEKLFGHKIILSTNSYFNKIFEEEKGISKIKIDIKKEYLLLLLDYIYSNQINTDNLNETNIIGFKI